jgi:transcription elongation factor SPT5
LLPSQISNRVEVRKNAVTVDRDGSEIQIGDKIQEQGGESRTGAVIWIYRSILFCQNSNNTIDNYGMFVVRPQNVKTIAAKGGRALNTGLDLTKMNPAMQKQSNGPNGAAGAMPPPRTIGRDKLIGKTIKIKKGSYKGLIGIVKDTTADSARVELHTKNKHITVAKESLLILDPVTGQPIDANNRFGGARPRQAGPTPAGRTPASHTSGRTPGMSSGGQTPAWSGSKTPSWRPNDAGGKTPAWGAAAMSGNKTPAWTNDGSRTAYGGNDGSRTAYGGPVSAYSGPRKENNVN